MSNQTLVTLVLLALALVALLAWCWWTRPRPKGDCLNCRHLTPAMACGVSKGCTFAPIFPDQGEVDRLVQDAVAQGERRVAKTLMELGAVSRKAQPIASIAIAQALERLRYVDRAVWDDVEAALRGALEGHHNPDLDELDCTLLLDLLRLYRHEHLLTTEGV